MWVWLSGFHLDSWVGPTKARNVEGLCAFLHTRIELRQEDFVATSTPSARRRSAKKRSPPCCSAGLTPRFFLTCLFSSWFCFSFSFFFFFRYLHPVAVKTVSDLSLYRILHIFFLINSVIIKSHGIEARILDCHLNSATDTFRWMAWSVLHLNVKHNSKLKFSTCVRRLRRVEHVEVLKYPYMQQYQKSRKQSIIDEKCWEIRRKMFHDVISSQAFLNELVLLSVQECRIYYLILSWFMPGMWIKISSTEQKYSMTRSPRNIDISSLINVLDNFTPVTLAEQHTCTKCVRNSDNDWVASYIDASTKSGRISFWSLEDPRKGAWIPWMK